MSAQSGNHYSKCTALSILILSFFGVIIGITSCILCVTVEHNASAAVWGFVAAFIAGCVMILNLENTVCHITHRVTECVLPYFGLLGVVACGGSVFSLAKYTAIAEEKRNNEHSVALPEYISSSVSLQALCWSIFLIWNVFYVEKQTRKRGYKYQKFTGNEMENEDRLKQTQV